MVTQESFGSLVRRYRREAELTQEALAERAGLSVRAIRAIETESGYQPRQDTVRLLLDALDLPAEEQTAFLRAAVGHGAPVVVVSEEGSGEGARHVIQPLPIGGYLGALPTGPLVAREDVLAPLLGALEEVEVGAARLVLLTGEPGVGKTRLAQEVTVRARDRGFLVAAGRCYEPEQTVAYYPFLDALAALFHLAPAEMQREAAERWPYLGALLPDLIEMPEVAGGQDEEQRVLRAVSAFLEALAESVPVAILLDDLHWADQSSLKLLLHLIRHLQTSPVLLLGTYQDVEVNRQHPLEGVLNDLQREGLADRIAVRRLPEEGTRQLISAIMGEEGVSQEFTAVVHSRTEGNPYFVQQVLRDLVERGDVFRRDGRWDRKAIAELTVPESIRSAVGQRLAKLSDETQAMLHEASVLGQVFRFEDLQAMGDHAEANVEAALEEAMTAALVQELDGERYAFDHALTQQSLYAELTARRRRKLHLAAASAIEQGVERQRAQRSAELAWHFLNGDDPERALPYTLQAGKLAEAVFAQAEAELQYRTVLGLTRELEKRQDEAEALEGLGRVLRSAGCYDDALKLLEEAAAIHHAAGNLEREVVTVGLIAETHYWRGSLDDGVTRVEAFVDALDGRDPPPGTAQLYLYHTANKYFARHTPRVEALAQWERVGALARDEGDIGAIIQAEAARGFVLRLLGRIDEAIQVQETVAPVAEQRGDERSVFALSTLAETYMFTGRFDQARSRLAGIIALYERHGNADMVAFCMAHIGATYFGEGDWQEARSWYERALQTRDSRSRAWGAILPLVRLGALAVYEGRWAEAERLLDDAMTLARDNQDGQWLSWVHDRQIERDLLRGQVGAALARHQALMLDPQQSEKLPYPSPVVAMMTLAGGDVDRADHLVERGIEYWGKEGPNGDPWMWLALRGRILAARGQWENAEAVLVEAIDRARAFRYVLNEARAIQWYGEVLAVHGEIDAARQRLQEAREIYARVGAAPYIEQTDEALAGLTG